MENEGETTPQTEAAIEHVEAVLKQAAATEAAAVETAETIIESARESALMQEFSGRFGSIETWQADVNQQLIQLQAENRSLNEQMTALALLTPPLSPPPPEPEQPPASPQSTPPEPPIQNPSDAADDDPAPADDPPKPAPKKRPKRRFW
jgi:hypothetical protein